MSRGRAVELSNLSAPVQPIIFVVVLHDVIFLVLRVVREPFFVLRVPEAQQHALAVVVLVGEAVQERELLLDGRVLEALDPGLRGG